MKLQVIMLRSGKFGLKVFLEETKDHESYSRILQDEYEDVISAGIDGMKHALDGSFRTKEDMIFLEIKSWKRSCIY